MPFQKIGGVRPYSRDLMTQTSTRTLHKEMDNILKDKEAKDKFYNEIKGSHNLFRISG